MNAVEAVVFDYGGVLTTPVAKSVRAWLKADGIDPASFSTTLKEWLGRDAGPGTPIHRLETGELSIADFEELFAARLATVTGTPVVAGGILSRFFAGMGPDAATYQLVGDLRAAGIRVALLSNSWGNTYPRERIDALFDPVVISGEIGMRKPDPAIYRHTLDLLGLPAEACVFVDDAEPNVTGATAVGMHGLRHHDAASTRAALARLVPALEVTHE